MELRGHVIRLVFFTVAPLRGRYHDQARRDGNGARQISDRDASVTRQWGESYPKLSVISGPVRECATARCGLYRLPSSV